MTCTELFRGYYKLNYKREDLLGGESFQKDIDLGNYTILRRSERGELIYFLTLGSTISIPWPWTNIFSSFYCHSGNELLYNREPDDKLERQLYLITKLQLDLIGSSKPKGDRFLSTLSDIIIEKTDLLRPWIKKETGIELFPIEFKSLRKTYEI